jgi:hypothetical protein
MSDAFDWLKSVEGMSYWSFPPHNIFVRGGLLGKKIEYWILLLSLLLLSSVITINNPHNIPGCVWCLFNGNHDQIHNQFRCWNLLNN